MRWKLLLFLGAIFLIALNSASAIEVYDCGFLESNGTSDYTLMNDVATPIRATPSDTCFEINASDITLDCNGYKVRGDYNGLDSAVSIDGWANTTVKNCDIENIYYAINLTHYANNSQIIDNNFSYTGITIRNIDSHNTNITRSLFNNSIVNGVYLDSSANFTFQYNNVTSSSVNMVFMDLQDLGTVNESYGAMISDNEIMDSNIGYVFAPRLSSTSDVTFVRNNLTKSRIYTLFLPEPTSVFQMDTWNLSNNTIDDKLTYWEVGTEDRTYKDVSLFFCFFCENVTVRDSRIDRIFTNGIAFVNTTWSKVENVTMLDNSRAITLSTFSRYNNISSNNITNAAGGIGVYMVAGNDNNFEYNLVRKGSYGLLIQGTSQTVRYNNVSEAITTGITETLDGNTITNNWVYQNRDGMITYYLASTIEDNNVSSNYRYGYVASFDFNNFNRNYGSNNTYADLRGSTANAVSRLRANNFTMYNTTVSFVGQELAMKGMLESEVPSDPINYLNFGKWLNISIANVGGAKGTFININFSYTDAELSTFGISDESKLLFMTSDGSNWAANNSIYLASGVNTASNYVWVDGLTDFNNSIFGIFELTADVEDPITTIAINDTTLIFTEGSTEIQFNTSDNVGVASINWNITFPDGSLLHEGLTNTVIRLSPSNLTVEGIYTTELSAVDTSANTNYTSQTFTVLTTAAQRKFEIRDRVSDNLLFWVSAGAELYLNSLEGSYGDGNDILIAYNNGTIGTTDLSFVDCSIGGSCSNLVYLDYNNVGNLNITEDVYIGNNLTINGTLHGGSPVKIAGVNITNNIFNLMENRNSSSRFSLQNLNDSSNATALITAKNDVDGSMSIGIASSNFKLGDKNLQNATALLSKSRGDTFFANFFNNAFRWFYNPQDDGEVNNLVEIMKLDENGLNVSSGNFTGNFINGEMLMHPDGNITVDIITKDIHENVTGFNITKLNGFTLRSNDTLVVGVAGRYMVDFWVSSTGGVNDVYETCISVNNVHTDAHAHRKHSSAGDVGSMAGGNILLLNKGDIINLQVRNTDGTADLTVLYAGVRLVRVGD